MRAAMGLPAEKSPPASPVLQSAREVFEAESRAIASLADRLDASFERAVELVIACRGRVVVSGMGKAGFIARKLSATFASTGTASHFLHPAEAHHGDLGRVVPGDLFIALSNSGETEELNQLLPSVARLGVPVMALTGRSDSTLARAAKVVLDIGRVGEACPLGLAPTTSAVALLAMGDALAMAVMAQRAFSPEDYAANHPGGQLGRRLRKVSEVMRTGDRNPVVPERATLGEAIGVMTRTPGRPGATSVVDDDGRLTGLFTDGDLRRLVEEGRIDFSISMSEVMTRKPRAVSPDMLAWDAAQVLRDKQIDQLPVVDAQERPVGLLDVQDLLAAQLFDPT